MPLIKQCLLCRTDFRTKPFFVKNGGGKYCSNNCSHIARRSGEWRKCFLCNKETYKQKRFLEKSKTKKFFCTKTCSITWQNTEFVREKHPNWKHGEYSYRNILKKDKRVKRCVLCKTKRENILAVHHIDKNRKNNVLKNLAWLCHNCHFLVHHHKDEHNKFAASLSA
ncbi:MAG TPA: HNH endonuclease [Candidatus Yonathbacteria bacterium]|nr:HNH endonuclease [Candidatus Yonathbacteria bacterium]